MTDSNDDTETGKDAGEPADAGNKSEEAPEAKRGSVRYQDAETATRREPTLAEKRAMRRALEEEEERQKTVEEAERKSLARRRLMIGAGVTVGVVATVALWYAASPSEVTANCVDNSSALSRDENICSESYVTSHGGYSSGGFFFLPIPGGGGYQQYHYTYGGSVSNGRVTGGSTAAPSGHTTIKSTSGQTIQRGGFGVSGGGKSGGS
jgi:hypothetical protein